jgi:lipopolysaccharide/colanic/teichoic acid biosynthesis glycosyltransferase
MAADREYAANCSLRLDLTIILDTVAKILTAKSVQEDGASTMLLFDEERRGTPAC